MKNLKKIILAFMLSANELNLTTAFLRSADANTSINRHTNSYFKNYDKKIVKNYSFSDCEDKLYQQRDAIELTMKEGHKVVFPVDLDRTKQKLDFDYVNKCFLKLPKKLRESVNVIKIVDFPCAYNTYWEKKYNIKDFEAFATAGKNQIQFYKYEYGNKRMVRDYFKSQVIAHESAHVFDCKLSNISNKKEWKDAVKKDTKAGCLEGVTDYSRISKSSREDFADSVNLYVHHSRDFEKQFPNRYKLIDKLLADQKNEKDANNDKFSTDKLDLFKRKDSSMDINQFSQIF